METVIEKIYNRHNEWVYMVSKYGCNRDTAEDIVQEMYLRLIVYLRKTNNDITYNDDVNLYFIARTLKSIFIDHIRKEKRNPVDPFDERLIQYIEVEQDDIINFDQRYEKIQKALSKMYWFDKKVYEIIESGVKVSELSEKTTIPYYTIYNTYNRVKKILKNII